MANFHGPAIGTINFSCYQNDDFDRTYERLRVMPAGPERAPLFAALTSLLDVHAPARILPSADDVTLIGSRVQGFAVNPLSAAALLPARRHRPGPLTHDADAAGGSTRGTGVVRSAHVGRSTCEGSASEKVRCPTRAV